MSRRPWTSRQPSSPGETFTPVPDWLARRIELSPTDKLVWAKVARYVKVFGRKARPGQKRIAGELGLHRRTVLRSLARLEAFGLLTRPGRSDLGTHVFETPSDHPWKTEFEKGPIDSRDESDDDEGGAIW